MSIPKTIHQIWLGGPMPLQFVRYAEKWRVLHPEWEYRLWTEKDLTWLAHAQEFADVPLFSTKANIARYEIVCRYGGVYIDSDFEPVKPIDSLLVGASMVVCPERPDLLANGFFGAAPGHPILQYLLSQLRECIKTNRNGSSPEMCGPVFFTRAVRRGMAFTGAPCRHLQRQYFYPYNYDEPELQATATFPAAYAIHRWAKSWVATAAPTPQRPPPLGAHLRAAVKQQVKRAVDACERMRAPGTRIVSLGNGRSLVDVQGLFPLLVSSDDLNILPELFMRGVSDAGYVAFLGQFLRPSDHVIDIGANIGYTVLAAARHLGPYGRLDAFEPNPVAHDYLRDNIYMNRMQGRLSADIRLHRVAIGASCGTATLRVPRGHRGRASLSAEVHARFTEERIDCTEVQVNVEPLEKFLKDITRVRLVKIDVEGYEAEIMETLLPFAASRRVDCIDLELIDELLGSSWVRLEHVLRDMVERLDAKCYTLRHDGVPERISLGSVVHGPPRNHLLLRFDEQ